MLVLAKNTLKAYSNWCRSFIYMHQGGLTLKHVHQTKIQWDSTIYISIATIRKTKKIYIHQQKKTSNNSQKNNNHNNKTNLLNIPPKVIDTSWFHHSGVKVLCSSSVHKEHQEDAVHRHACPGKNLRWSLVSSVSVWGGWGRAGFYWGVSWEYHLFVQIFFCSHLRGKRFF